MLLTSAANMLFILMIYMAMQNPSAYIDSETRTSDEQAFLIQMKNVTEQSGKKVFFVVHIRQMHHIEMLLGYENSRRLFAEVGHYLTALCGKFCVFRNAEDTFTILLDEGKEEDFCHDGGVLCAGSVCESCQNAEKYGRCAGSGIGCVYGYFF